MVAVVLFAILGISAPAQAGTATDVALGLASFAVFNQLVGTFARPFYAPPVHAAPVVVAPPPVVYHPTPVYVAPAPPPPRPTVVEYPHGRYELRRRGHHHGWVWIPALPAPPPPYAPPGY
jgi:hypothetical protein